MSNQLQKATTGNGAICAIRDLTDVKLHRGSSFEAAVCLNAIVTLCLLAGQSRTSLPTHLC